MCAIAAEVRERGEGMRRRSLQLVPVAPRSCSSSSSVQLIELSAAAVQLANAALRRVPSSSSLPGSATAPAGAKEREATTML